MRGATRIKYTAAFALLLAFAPAFGQSTSPIRSEKLKDGVERWYRAQTVAAKPWFFQQVENLFNVVLPSKDQLPFGVSVAFLVGVSQYDYLSPQLPFVKNDVRDMRDFLLNQGGFDTVYVASERIVDRDLIEEYMRNKLPQRLSKRDRLLLYYSGHGADSGGKTGYMQFAQAQAGNFAGRHVLAINDAEDWSRESKLAHLLCIFDCCASGLAFTPKSGGLEKILALSREGSRLIITAGTANEKTFEVQTSAGKGNGVFTRAFLNAAGHGKTDLEKDGFITLDEIFAQLKNEVADFSVRYKQPLTPLYWQLQKNEYRSTFVFVNPTLRNLTLAPEYAQPLNATPRSAVVAQYGTIQLLAFLDGKVFIDGVFVDDIASGEEKMYDQRVGARKVEVRGASETAAQTVQVAKGRLTPLTLRPQRTTPLVEKQVELQPIVAPQSPPGMVYIPSGSFKMGSNDGDKDEKPIHEVYIDAFFMGETEVSVEQYEFFLNAT